MGRAYYNGVGSKSAEEYLPSLDAEDCDTPTLLINVHGDIYVGCDWSYAAQKRFKKEVCLGNAITDSVETIESNYRELCKRGTKVVFSEVEVTFENEEDD